MAFVYQELMGRFALTNANLDLVVGTTSVTLTNGLYYVDGYVGESASQLCNHLQTKIRAVPDQASTNVVYGGVGAGLINICLTTNANITFTSTGLATILGFPSTSTNVAVHQGTRKPRYIWRPTDPAMEYAATIENPWLPIPTTRYRRAADCSMHSTPGTTAYETFFAYQALPLADVLKATPQDYRSLQEFFEDVVCAGKRLRLYTDRTQRNADGCFECYWGEEEPAAFIEQVERLYRNYQGYWKTLKLPFWKWVS